MKPYYQDSACTIYHGDCRAVVPALGRFDLLLTDPPYGINENSKKQRSREKSAKPTDYGEFDWDREPPPPWLLEMLRSVSDYQIIWGGNFFGLPPSSCWLVWDKDNTGDFADCELAWTNFKKAVRKKLWRWNGMIQHDMANKEPRLHPTQKPLPVILWAIGEAPETVKTILDPFMGSGTTLRAAKDKGLQSVGIDAEERYCEIAAKRLQQEVLALA